MTCNAIERQLPELTFDDVNVTIDQLTKKVTRALSRRISVIIDGDRTISFNRVNIMQLFNLCTAKISVASREKGEKIKEEGSEKLKEYKTICEANANLPDVTKRTIEYIVSASTFFSETKNDNENILNAKRIAQVGKDTAQHKVDVCNNMLSFLDEKKVSAEAMLKSIAHNRNGRKGEIYQLSQLEGALAPAKTWGGLVSSGLGWLWSRGGAKPAETLAPAEVDASAAAEALPTGGAEKVTGELAAPEITTNEIVTVSSIPTKLSFKDAVDQQATTPQQSDRQRIASTGKRNLLKPSR